MVRQDDRAARVLARTRELEAESNENSIRRSPPKSRKSEKIVVNDQEVDIDSVVQKVRERLSKSIKSTKIEKEFTPQPPPSLPKNQSPRSYVERASPKTPRVSNRLDVAEIRDITRIPTYEPAPAEAKVSPMHSYASFKKSTREELDEQLKDMNSHQLRSLLQKMRTEKSQRSVRTPVEEKVPVYDPDTGNWVLYPRTRLREPEPEVPRQQGIQPPLIRRGTTRDAYPTRTFNEEPQTRTQTMATGIDAVNPDQAVEEIDIDFDSMTEIQAREFLDEMKMKFAVLKKNYPDFPVPKIHDDDNPKWVYGIYEQLLDMAKGDASQPMYQSGMQIVFLLIQVALTMAGIPAKNFFSFHAKHFHKYNQLMTELGEKWGPIIDVTSSIETKLAISIGWNTMVFAIVSVVANKYGDKIGSTVEQLLDKFSTGNEGTNNQINNLKQQLDGREEVINAPPPAADSGGMGGIANLLGGLLGGSGGGGGLGNLLGGLMGGSAAQNMNSRERKLPVYDDE